ncbi:calcium-binding protein [Inquilinus sp. CA228]|uniref:calcium-binding protein n=1 Tax=Inquilinus sp. CA228 TaxID=3455609 RepID=UPI003F8D5D3C
MGLVNGTAGNDMIHVAGDGVVAPPGFTDIALATAFNDTLNGLGGADVLYGGGGNDLIDGGDGSDILVGGIGADTLLGGAGTDTISYSGGTAGVDVDLATGRGSLGDAEGDTLSGVENVQGTNSPGGDGLYGSAVANTLTGLGGDDTLLGLDGNDMLLGGDGDDYMRGGAGADRLDGGAGIDLINYHFSTAGVAIDLSTGRCSGGDAQGDTLSGIEDIGGSGRDDTLTGSAVANLLYGLEGNDVLSGLGGDDELAGYIGDDVLRGGAGADLLMGDTGIDLVSFYGAAAAVSVSLGTGTGAFGDAQGDTYTDIENVNGGTAGDRIVGNTAANVLNGYEDDDSLFGVEGDDTLLGGAGDDALQGGAGADRLDGGAGIDTIDYFGNAGVTVNLSTGLGSGGDAQGDVISGIEIVWAAGYDDTLIGSSAANRLMGAGGNDTLRGLGGSDTLIGAEGDDTLLGGDGDDVLYVGAGADVMDGGAGRDTFMFAYAMVADFQAGMVDGAISADSWGSLEVLQGSDGNDTIRTISLGFAMELRGSAGDDVLATAVEATFGDTLSGEDGNDQLNGGAGNDVLRGGAGADVLVGAGGIDTASYYSGTVGVVVSLASGAGGGGEAQGDTLSGIENLSGSQGWDSLYGNAGANMLQGWNGNDALVGRAGKDTLTGGAGADRFTFTTITDSVVGANADRITDFSHAQGDRIDLAGIDARTNVAGDQVFGFIGTALFTGVAGQLRFAFTSPGVTTIAGDVNGDKVSDVHITLTGTIILVAGDFVL